MLRRSAPTLRLTLAAGVLALAAASIGRPAPRPDAASRLPAGSRAASSGRLVARRTPVAGGAAAGEAAAPAGRREGAGREREGAPAGAHDAAPAGEATAAAPPAASEPEAAPVAEAQARRVEPPAGESRGGGRLSPGQLPWQLSALVEGDEPMPTGQPTPLELEQIGRLLAQAHRELYGVAPGPERLLVAWAHVALEVSRGATCIEHNLINVVVSLRWRGSWHVRRVAENIDHDPDRKKILRTRFRGYATPYEGALDYWRVMAGHFGSALALFDRGDARGAGRRLCERGFSTGSCEGYGQGINGLYSELRAAWAHRLGVIVQPASSEPMRGEDWARVGAVQGQDACVLQSVAMPEPLSR